jgi:hypothetical protein
MYRRVHIGPGRGGREAMELLHGNPQKREYHLATFILSRVVPVSRGSTQRHAVGAKVRVFVRNPDELANERVELARLLNKAGTCFLHEMSLSAASGFHCCLLSVLQLNVRCLVGKVSSVAFVVLHEQRRGGSVFSVKFLMPSHTQYVQFAMSEQLHGSKIFR